MVAVRGAGLVEARAGGREGAGGERAREDEALEPEALAGIEQQAGSFDVGAPVLGCAPPEKS
jgi:hypothetical protein